MQSNLERLNSELFAVFNPDDEIFVGATSSSKSTSYTNAGSDGGTDSGNDS